MSTTLQSVAAEMTAFARFLEHVPGCFVFLSNGVDSLPLHNAAFDFNDDALGYGVRFHLEWQ